MHTLRYIFLVSALLLIFNVRGRAQWVHTNGPYAGAVYALASKSDSTLFAATKTGCSRSTDNGNNWVTINNGLAGGAMYSLSVDPAGNLFGGSFNAGIFRSTNNGTNWTRVYISLAVVWGFAISSDGTIFAGTDFEGVVRSTDGGTGWSQVGLTGRDVLSLTVNPTGTVFAGRRGDGVYRSSNRGDSWTPVNNGLGNLTVWSLMTNANNHLFAGTNNGVYRSTDNGESWTLSGISGATVVTLTRTSDGALFAGSTSRGVYLSRTGGASWTQMNTGLTDTSIYTLTVSGTSLFAGTSESDVWRRSLSEMVTSAEYSPSEVPASFRLDQNYPNPFNPVTTISFTLPSKSFVSLKVFDALGKEVSVLVSQELPGGRYSTKWNAGGLPSGVYFYRLQAGSFTETKKLVLLR